MRLAMRLPPKKGDGPTGESGDPRERESAEIIDLASRAAFPAVTDRKAKGDGFQMAAGVAVVGLLGAVTFWAMNSARTPDPQGIGNPAVAPPPPAAPAPGQRGRMAYHEHFPAARLVPTPCRVLIPPPPAVPRWTAPTVRCATLPCVRRCRPKKGRHWNR